MQKVFITLLQHNVTTFSSKPHQLWKTKSHPKNNSTVIFQNQFKTHQQFFNFNLILWFIYNSSYYHCTPRVDPNPPLFRFSSHINFSRENFCICESISNSQFDKINPPTKKIFFFYFSFTFRSKKISLKKIHEMTNLKVDLTLEVATQIKIIGAFFVFQNRHFSI